MDTDHDKIIRVEEKINALNNVVYEIKDNHLAHLSTDISLLKDKVDGLSTRLAVWSGGVVVVVWVIDKFIV